MPKNVLKLLRDRYFWYITAFVGFSAVFIYLVEPNVFEAIPALRSWHSVLITLRNFSLLSFVGFAAWRFGLKGGLFTYLAIIISTLPHVLSETVLNGLRAETLAEYFILFPVGFLTAWLIDARKQVEKSLSHSGKFFKDVFNSTNDAISIINVNDFTIAGANKAFLDQYGLMDNEVIGKTCYELTHHRSTPCSPPGNVCPLVSTVTTGKHSTVEHVHHTRGNSRIYVEIATSPLRDAEGKIIQVVHVTRDITESKKAEQTLRLQANLLDAELDSVYLLDLSGNILYANKVACSSSGYSKEELLNMNINQLDDTESSDMIVPRIKAILEKGHGTYNVNHRRKDGSLIPMEIHTSLVESEGVQFLLGVARDTTERRKLQEQLMAQDRLASIGQLVAGVAHELGNPLGSLILYSEFLLHKELPDDVSKDLKTINEEAVRTSDIVKNLLTFARKQPKEKLLFDMNETIRRVVALRNHEEKVNNILVNLNLAPGLPEILGNVSQLQQVFLNLIINAEQSMLEAHKKGVLTITTEQSGDMVKASFVDDGPGISPENMKQLFTPFFTTKGVGKGTGLGLSICHGIVTEHGGKIYAESKLGKGAAFFVEFPASKSK